MTTSKNTLSVFAHFEYSLTFCDIFGTVYEEIALYIGMYTFLKTFGDKRSLILYYDKVLLIFEEIFFDTFSV